MQADPAWAEFLAQLDVGSSERMRSHQSKLDTEQQRALLETWSRLQTLLDSRGLKISELVSGTNQQPEMVTTLLFAYLNNLRQALKSPTDDQLNDELRLFIFLLRILGLQVPTGLTLKRHPMPKQAFPRTSAEDLALASRLPVQLVELFSQIYQGKAPPLTSEEIQGALTLALVLESGVHGLGELRAALTHARTQPVRATRGLRYFWLKLGESRGVVLEHRRTFLTPLAAAIAFGLHRESSVAECDIKSAVRAIGRRLGYRRQRLSVTRLASAASTTLRAKRDVAQFIVDYADQLFVCHSVGEKAWRRIVKLSPWPDEDIEDDATSRAQEPEPPEDELIPTTPPIRADALYRTSRILNTATSTEASLDRLTAGMSEIRAQCTHLPILQELLSWLMTLHTQPSSNGQVRKIRSIRNLFNGLAARAVAVYRDRPLHAIDSEEWLYVLDAITDDPISESWRNTIRYAVYHFLSDLTQRGVIPESPFKETIGRAGSAVNANVLTQEEFDRCIKFLLSRQGAITRGERACGFVLSTCWQYGLRRAEALGLLAQEVCDGADPTLDIVNNALRELKTDSSPRRIPLAPFWDKVMARLLSLQAEVKQGALLGQWIDTDQWEGVGRRANALIQTATADPTTHLHVLRHSFATWELTRLEAGSLKLDRFVDDMPFLKDFVGPQAEHRDRLRQRQSTLHDLHADRALLGHRHEDMSLLHYIHCLDYMRYAAVTLNRETVPASALIGAAGLTRNVKKLRKTIDRVEGMGESEALSLIETLIPDAVMRHDVELTLTHDQALGMEIYESSTYGAWQGQRKPDHWGADEAAKASVAAAVSEEAVVELINKRNALGARKRIERLDDIQPTAPAQRRMALGIAQSVEDQAMKALDHRSLAQTVIASVHQRGSGIFGFKDPQEARPVVQWLRALGDKSHFVVELFREVNTTDRKSGKRKRGTEVLPDIDDPRFPTSGRVFLRLRWTGKGERKALPHAAFIWAMGCAASR